MSRGGQAPYGAMTFCREVPWNLSTKGHTRLTPMRGGAPQRPKRKSRICNNNKHFFMVKTGQMSKIRFLTWTMVSTLLLVPATAFAQDDNWPDTIEDACYSLAQNETWSTLFSEFADAFSRQDYPTALEKTASLREICERSPILNFSIAQTYYQMGDKETALKYIHEATNYTREFSVTDEIAVRMWDFRHDLEHADEIAAKDNELKKTQNALEASDLRVKELGDEIEKLRAQNNDSIELSRKNAKKIWLSGAVVGGVGVAMLACSAGILAYAYGDATPVKLIEKNDGKTKAEIKWPITAGWSLFGIGLGMTAAGAVMAGIGGYQYTHLDDNVTLSMAMSPLSLDLTLNF